MKKEPHRVTVTLNLDPELEKGLSALALQRGVSLSDYLLELAAREAAYFAEKTGSTGDEKARAFLEWADSFPDTPPLSDEDINRASIYPDRL